MLPLLGLLLFLVVVFLFLFPLALWRRGLYNQYSGTRAVVCPEDNREVAVRIDASHAATTGMNGRPELRLSDCSRWPARWNCDRACLPQALHAGPYASGEAKVGRKRIYHLPILIAAFAAWYVGMVWHSRFLFRARWAEAIGFTPAQVGQIVRGYGPHVLTMAICVLFAYGVAWLLAAWHRKGAGQGMLMAVLLSGAVVLANLPGVAKLPRDLLMIEAGYAVLATLIVGAIVGGLSDKLVVRRM